LCIYHAPCADGFTAAWVVRMALGDAVEFYPGVYGEAPPPAALVGGRDVILVDFSYKRRVIDEMATYARSVIILDHHKTARDDLAGMRIPRSYGSAVAENMVGAVFDMDRSGAQVTWDFFFPNSKRPLLVDYTGDRDLWLFKLPESREVNAYVFAHEYTFEEWDGLALQLKTLDNIKGIADMGGAIEKKHFKDVHELVAVSQRRMTIGGVLVPVANLPYTMASDAGHIMSQGEAFAATYIDTQAVRRFSLRSSEGGADVSLVAKQYGGGGHVHAAGFEVPREALDALGLL
jgi:oligoribonuclease NrnB/cAMP/cGMP phosphodiesterase (DHH superfamily)